jgi:cytochrome b pre-mRNA-processing protein 3
MFSRFLKRDRQTADIPAALYGAIVAQARAPVFYARLGVADTVDGRFELLIAHLAVVLKRLGGAGDEAKAIGQAVFDLFCADMDRSLRELGVGDLAVPKRMKRMAEAYYGRAAAYGAALDRGQRQGLADVVRRNLLGGADGAADEIAAYLIEATAAIEAMPLAAFAEGRLAWPDPALIRAGSPA